MCILYNVNWFVFITNREGVYCADWSESVNVFQFNFRLERVDLCGRQCLQLMAFANNLLNPGEVSVLPKVSNTNYTLLKH